MHTTQDRGPGCAAPLTPRSLVLDGTDGSPDRSPATGEDAVRLPLPGGWTATAWAARLDTAPGSLAALDRIVDVAG